MIEIYDIDGTLILADDMPNRPLIDYINRDVEEEGVQIFILSARPISRLPETEDFLNENDVPYSSIYLNDFSETPGPEVGAAFKAYKLSKLVDEYGDQIAYIVDNDPDMRKTAEGMGVLAYSPEELLAHHAAEERAPVKGMDKFTTEKEAADRAIDPKGYIPNDAMVEEANQALGWRRVFGRGGTLVGVARARDISERNSLPFETVRRMASFFARHEVDKDAEGFNRGEDGYPSAGRIAWGLWGGDAGRAWADSIIREADEERAARSVEDKMGIEFRTAKVELRAVDDTGMEFEGYAALFDSPSADGTIPEVVKNTAFNRSLSAVDRNEWDVRAYQDHDPKLLLGTTKSGTLSLRSDEKGLLAKIKLNPDISFHRDLAAIVRSMGSSLGMSFGFWNTSSNKVNADGVRELRDVKLVEVSALTGLAPYYPGTVSLVSVRGLAAKAGVDTDELRDAVAALLAGEANEGHASILASAIAASSRDVEGVPTKFPGDEPAAPVAEPASEPVAEELVEDVPAKAVPRAIRERQIQLARRTVR